MISTSIRHSNKGQSVIVIGMIVALLFLLSVGLYAFELNRLEVARQQLQSACEAAALAGAATLAGSDERDPYNAHTNAMATALHEFQQNSVAGTSLGGANQAINANTNPAPGDSNIYIEFLDPHNNYSVVSLGDSNGKIVKVYGALGFQPAFGKFLGIGNLPLRAVASGGVPQLDVVLCFDVSASIDDQTPVTFVRRQWNSGTGRIDYIKTTTANGSPAGTIAQGPLYNILVPPPTGSTVNALAPQSLSQAGYGSYPLQFNSRLRGSSDNSPPGNKGSSVSIGTRDFTDLVVNIDGKNNFGGFTYKGYPFPDVATLVEAARGNLENSMVMQNSNADKGVPSTVKAMAGYQAMYREIALQNIHPLYDAQQACQTFLDIMNTNTDAHFSLCCFTTNAGRNATDYFQNYNVDNNFASSGRGQFPVHLIGLQSGLNTGYEQCRADIGYTVACASTNIGDAVNTAVKQLTGSGARMGAKKAIVVFTDGQPTTGGPLNNNEWTNARLAAKEAKKNAIPIYSIGLAQIPAIIPGETKILNDIPVAPGAETADGAGISGIAGNGGKFWLVTNNANLRLTFENLARQLVQLVK